MFYDNCNSLLAFYPQSNLFHWLEKLSLENSCEWRAVSESMCCDSPEHRLERNQYPLSMLWKTKSSKYETLSFWCNISVEKYSMASSGM